MLSKPLNGLSKVFLVLISTVVVLCMMPVWAATTPQAGIGAVDDMVLHDSSRNKNLHIRVTYPTGEGKFPIIIFSHGAGGSKDSYQYLIKYWAYKGYICIQPTHADAIGKIADREVAFRRLMSVIRAIPFDYAGWNNRVADIRLVLDSLPTIQKRIPAQMDETRIGLGGHSYGAFTTVIVGGAKVPEFGEKIVKNGYDKRITAILVVSPQGVKHSPHDFGFDNKSAWEWVHEPAMFMTGTVDKTGWTTTADRRAAFEDCPSGDKYFIDIQGANHMTFAGGAQKAAQDASSTSGQLIKNRIVERVQQRRAQAAANVTGRLAKFFGPLEQGDHQKLLEAIELASTDFWNAYLMGNSVDKELLQSKQIEKDNSLIQIESK